MAVFQSAVDATFAAFGIDALYTPAGGTPVPVRVIARRPDAIVGFGETRIHAETATFDVRATDDHAAVKSTGTKQRRVENVRAVGRSHQDHAVVRFETVHFDQQLVQSLFAFIVTAA